MGILQTNPEDWFQQSTSEEEPADIQAIEKLIAERSEARNARAFDKADKLRAQLEALGVVVEDREGQTEWRRLSS